MAVASNRHIPLLLLALLLFTSGAPPLSPQEREAEPRFVALLAVSLDEEESTTTDKIIFDSMRVALEIEGFRTTSLEREPGSDPVDWSSLYGSVSESGADLILAALFTRQDGQVEIDFQLHDATVGKLLHSLEADGKLDLSFDKIVASAVNEIVAKAGISVDQTAGDTESAAGDMQEGDTVIVSGGAGPSNRTGQPFPPPVPAQAPDLPPPEPAYRFEVSAGFSPFLTVGSTSDYFRIGYLPSAVVSYHLPTSSGYIAFGVYGGVHLFHAEGIIASAGSLLVPVGVDFRLSPVGGSRLSLYLRLSGGPAVLVINPNETGAMAKLLPYVLGGLGFSIAILPRLGVTIDSSFTIFYEKSLPIMGFTPSVYIHFRL